MVTRTIIEEWQKVKVPQPPEIKKVRVSPQETALLVLDVQNQNCNEEKRPQCIESLPNIQKLLKKAREKGILIVYSLTRTAVKADIREEVAPWEGEPVVASGVDKFYQTDLEKMLKERTIKTVIIVGTSAHGAVLHTATGAVLRGYEVIVPLDGISAEEPYAEQYTVWHLINAPGTRGKAELTTVELIEM